MDISEVISITRPSTFNNIDNINNDDNNLDIEMSDEQGHTQSASAKQQQQQIQLLHQVN